MNELGLREESQDEWNEEKTRNETDIIRSRIRKTIEQDLADDPYAQVYFSELLKMAIAEAEAMFEHPYKQYALFKDIEEKVETREVDGIPDDFGENRHARAYYGIFRMVMGEGYFVSLEDEDRQAFIDAAGNIEETVKRAISEFSLSPQNIEAEIRKNLLPALFALIGLDSAKDVIEKVITVTRTGLAKGA